MRMKGSNVSSMLLVAKNSEFLAIFFAVIATAIERCDEIR
jgi:hypothetical protein